jgi:hypothetical protein
VPSNVATTSRIANSGAWAGRSGFATASALYVLSQNTSTGKLQVSSSTNGTTWTLHDNTNAPTNFSATHPYSGYLQGAGRTGAGYLYVIYFNAANSCRVRRFNTATNTWETTDVGTNVSASSITNTLNVGLVVRSDGDVIAFFHVVATGLNYSRYEGASWFNAAVQAVASAWVNSVAIDSADRTYFTYADNTNNDNTYRTLNAANALGTETDFDATAHTTAKLRYAGSAVYHEGTAERLFAIGRDTGGEIDGYTGTIGATLGTQTAVQGISTSVAPNLTSTDVSFFGTGSAGRVHVVWGTANAFLHDVSTTAAAPYTFGTDITILSGLADADVCPQWINGLSGLGVLYQESGTVKVEWITAPTPPGSPGTLTVATATATADAEDVTFDAASNMTVAAATATAQAQAVDLTGGGGGISATLTVTAATATAQAEAITFDTAAILTVAPATATAAAQAITFDAASALTIAPATATAAGQAVNLAAAQAATFTVGAATATAQAEAVTFDTAARLVVAAATATAQAEAVTFDTAARLIAGDAAATAQAQGVTFDAAASLTLSPATATAQAGSVALGAGAAASLAVIAATAAAQGEAVTFDAGATFTTTPATAAAQGEGVTFDAAAVFAAIAAAATAQAEGVALTGAASGAAAMIASAATATAQAGAVVLTGGAPITGPVIVYLAGPVVAAPYDAGDTDAEYAAGTHTLTYAASSGD